MQAAELWAETPDPPSGRSQRLARAPASTVRGVGSTLCRSSVRRSPFGAMAIRWRVTANVTGRGGALQGQCSPGCVLAPGWCTCAKRDGQLPPAAQQPLAREASCRRPGRCRASRNGIRAGSAETSPPCTISCILRGPCAPNLPARGFRLHGRAATPLYLDSHLPVRGPTPHHFRPGRSRPPPCPAHAESESMPCGPCCRHFSCFAA